jgi:hypothetical protein
MLTTKWFWVLTQWLVHAASLIQICVCLGAFFRKTKTKRVQNMHHSSYCYQQVFICFPSNRTSTRWCFDGATNYLGTCMFGSSDVSLSRCLRNKWAYMFTRKVIVLIAPNSSDVITYSIKRWGYFRFTAHRLWRRGCILFLCLLWHRRGRISSNVDHPQLELLD